MPPCQIDAQGLGVWPLVKLGAWCGRYSSTIRTTGVKPKVSDATLIEMVWDRVKPMLGNDGKPLPPQAAKRSFLVDQLKEMGMTDTPALKKIQRLVDRGIFKQGKNPWPMEGDAPGIYVWMETNKPMPPGEEDFFARFKALVPDQAHAKSMRAIWREIQGQEAISLTTVARRINALVATGHIVVTESGYYPAAEGNAVAVAQAADKAAAEVELPDVM